MTVINDYLPGHNSLILQGKLSTDLTNVLIACQKKTGKSVAEIDASPVNNLNDNGSVPTTSAANNANNPSVVPVNKLLSGAMLGTDKCQSEFACLRSQCNLQCDCKCGILVAELEGIKLDMVIMQRNIESNSRKANIAQEEEVKRLEKELANEREKNKQLETDILILVKGRDAEISELNNIIASLQNKLEAWETLINQSPMLGNGYINMHRLDGTKEFLSSSETKVCLSLKQNSTYCPTKKDENELSTNDHKNERVNQTRKQIHVSQEEISSVQMRPEVSKHNKAIIPRSQLVCKQNMDKNVCTMNSFNNVIQHNPLQQENINQHPIPTRITCRERTQSKKLYRQRDKYCTKISQAEEGFRKGKRKDKLIYFQYYY